MSSPRRWGSIVSMSKIPHQGWFPAYAGTTTCRTASYPSSTSFCIPVFRLTASVLTEATRPAGGVEVDFYELEPLGGGVCCRLLNERSWGVDVDWLTFGGVFHDCVEVLCGLRPWFGARAVFLCLHHRPQSLATGVQKASFFLFD
jgi:hypothetical protein